MRFPVVPPAAILAALVVIATPAVAQSLADVARKEEARRNAIRSPARTYTNANLTADFTIPPNPPEAAKSAPPAPGTANAPVATNASPSEETGAEAPKEELDEKFWRARAVGFRARIQKARQDVESLTGPPHADPREQAKIESLLKMARGVVLRAEEAQRVFEMQADAAKVPREWIQ